MKKIKRLWRFYKSSILFIMLFLFGTVAIFVGIIPAATKLFALQKNIQALTNETQSLQKKISILNTLDTENVQKNFQTTLMVLPSDKNIISFIGLLETTANEMNVPIVDFAMDSLGSVGTGTESAKKRTSEEQKLGVQILSSTITIEGTLENIRNYIDAVQKISRLMRVKNFDLSFSSKRNVMRCQIYVDAYYTPPLKVVEGKINDPVAELNSSDLDVLTKFESLQEFQVDVSPEVIPESSASSTVIPKSSNPFSSF